MINLYFKYWFFKRKATNQHGVHSPFLYALVCSCFYNKDWRNIRQTPWNQKKHDEMSGQILEQVSKFNKHASTKFQIEPLKIVFTKNKTLEHYKKKLETDKEPRLTLIDNLHNQRAEWNAIINSQQFIILDFYFYGIIIQRPQQIAETFFLKIF